MQCQECGTEFDQGNRLNKKYCSPNCQQKAERRRYRAKRIAAGTWNRGADKKKKKKDLPLHDRKCGWCESEFKTKYPHAKYCGRECASTVEARRTNWKRWGGTVEGFTEAVRRSGGRCEICSKEEGLNLHYDHDHATGEPRGVLCSRCNTTLGLVEKDRAVLEGAVEYLSKKVA